MTPRMEFSFSCSANPPSSARNLRNEPKYKSSRDQSLCENTELIKCAGNGQASAILEGSKRVVYDFLVSLRNACPSSFGRLGGAWVLIWAQPSRTNRDDSHVISAQFLFKSQGKCGQKGSCRRIHSSVWDRLESCGRRHIDYALVPLFQEGRKETIREFRDGFVVETQHLDLPTDVEIPEFSAKAEARIIDEQIDLQVGIGKRLSKLLTCPRCRQINDKATTVIGFVLRNSEANALRDSTDRATRIRF